MINVILELSSVADWIVVGLTASGVIIAFIGLCLAFRTVKQWKDEKEWDIVLEAIANAEKTVNYYSYLVNTFKSSLEYYKSREIFLKEDGENIDDSSFLHKKKNKSKDDIRYIRYDDSIFILNEKLKHITSKSTNDLKEFYSMVSDKLKYRENQTKDLDEITNSIIDSQYFGMEKDEEERLTKEMYDKVKFLIVDDKEVIPMLETMVEKIKGKNIGYFLSNKRKPLISRGLQNKQ